MICEFAYGWQLLCASFNRMKEVKLALMVMVRDLFFNGVKVCSIYYHFFHLSTQCGFLLTSHYIIIFMI